MALKCRGRARTRPKQDIIFYGKAKYRSNAFCERIETLERQYRARFVVPAVKRMPKAQAATSGPVKNHFMLPHAQGLPEVLFWYFDIHDTIKAVTYDVAFCMASLVHPSLQ